MMVTTEIDSARVDYFNQEAKSYADWMRYTYAMDGKTPNEEFITYKSEQHAHKALDNAIASNKI